MKFIILLLIIALILCFPFPIKISLLFQNNKFFIYIYGINVSSRKKKKREKIDDKEKAEKNSKYTLFQKIVSINYALDKAFLRHKLKCKLQAEIIYGLEDPFSTAMFYPISTFFTDMIRNYSLKFINYKKSHINIKPQFKKNLFQFSLKGIIYISIGKIILIGYYILKKKKNYKKRGENYVTSN